MRLTARMPSIIRMLILALSVVGHTVSGQPTLEGNAMSVIMTPPLDWKVALGGYGARMSQPADDVHDHIMAKSLVIQDGTKKFAIVTMDVLGFPPNVKSMIVDALAGSGWNQQNVLLLPSHAHSSLEMFALNDKNIFGMPAIGIFQPRLLDFVVTKISTLIINCEKDLQPIKVGTGQMTLEGHNRNRRGDQAVDKELTVTRIDQLDNQTLAVLVNWTAHPTIMDESDMWVSGGWPGYLQRELEGWIGGEAVSMYYNGAEGDQSVIAQEGGSHYEKAERYGRSLARQAFALYEQIDHNTMPVFKYHHRVIELPATQAHPSFMKTGGEEYQLDEEKIGGLLKQVFPTSTHTTSLQLGSLVILGAPGEMIAEMGLDIKTALKGMGAQYPVIGGLANEWVSYILTEDEYHQGGYETSVSFYGPTLGEVVRAGMIESAKALISAEH